MKNAHDDSIWEDPSTTKPVYADLTQVETRGFVVEFEGDLLTCSYDDNHRVWFPKHDIERILLGQLVTNQATIMHAQALRAMGEDLSSPGTADTVAVVEKIRRVLLAIQEACPVEMDIFAVDSSLDDRQ
ncbi:MAG: hypothetical protein O7E52_09570 [Candidatus Poribacteria bacterium]|nr:hypothetical protein [Candidatus Poribacteria bacterium]